MLGLERKPEGCTSLQLTANFLDEVIRMDEAEADGFLKDGTIDTPRERQDALLYAACVEDLCKQSLLHAAMTLVKITRDSEL